MTLQQHKSASAERFIDHRALWQFQWQLLPKEFNLSTVCLGDRSAEKNLDGSRAVDVPEVPLRAQDCRI